MQILAKFVVSSDVKLSFGSMQMHRYSEGVIFPFSRINTVTSQDEPKDCGSMPVTRTQSTEQTDEHVDEAPTDGAAGDDNAS